MFKPHPIEFFQTELDALAAEVGKLATEVEFFFTEEVRDGVVGRVLGVKPTTESAAPAAEPVAEPAAVPEAEAPAAEAQAALPL